MTTETRYREIIKEIVNWIEFNLQEELVIDDVVRRAGYTKWHFQRIWTEITGIPLHQYITARRMTEIALMLPKHPTETIGDVAIAWGFTSHVCFNRVFKKRFGVTPGAVKRGIKVDPELLLPRLEL